MKSIDSPRRWSFVSRLSSTLMLSASLIAGSTSPAFARGGGGMRGGGGGAARGGGAAAGARAPAGGASGPTPQARPAPQAPPSQPAGSTVNRTAPATHSGRTGNVNASRSGNASANPQRQRQREHQPRRRREHPAQHRGPPGGAPLRACAVRLRRPPLLRAPHVRVPPLHAVRVRRRVLSLRRLRGRDGGDRRRDQLGEHLVLLQRRRLVRTGEQRI